MRQSDPVAAPVSDRCFLYLVPYTALMSAAHTTRQNLTDALVWLSETIVCALVFSAFAWFFLGGIIEDSGWRAVLLGVSVWLLGALCATIDVRHRRRKRSFAIASST